MLMLLVYIMHCARCAIKMNHSACTSMRKGINTVTQLQNEMVQRREPLKGSKMNYGMRKPKQGDSGVSSVTR